MTTPTTRPRVIVIDDSKLMRVSIRNVLKDEFTLVEAESGERGWDLLCADPTLQVVITDAQMPGIDGYELIARIRACDTAPLRSLPIIMITGADDETARERALKAGATDFITKPFDKTQLLARIRAHANADNTTRKLAQTTETLAEQGAVDALTGISSRRYFIERGTQELAFSVRRNQDLSVVALHVDRYDDLLQQHGQAQADKILGWVAKKLKETVRTEDTVARIEGATFAIIAGAAGRLEAAVLCERARKALNGAPWTDSGQSIVVTGSLGLVCLSYDKPANIEAFLMLANQRAARAGAAGGNRTVAAEAVEKRPAATPEPTPGIEAALQMVAARNTEKLHPHFIALLRRLLPLFEAANDKLNLGIGEHLAAIKSRLQKP